MISTLFLLVVIWSGQVRAEVADLTEGGAYLVKIAGCADCHSVDPSQPFAGGLQLDTPFGAFFTPNISPDLETGIGGWTLQDFQNALHGRSPQGEPYYPVFPYHAYDQITSEDVGLMWNYLKGQKPIHKVNRPHNLNWRYRDRKALWIWQWLFLAPTYTALPQNPQYNRGAYIAEALAHCTECHTPRNDYLGFLESKEWMGGGSVAVGGRIPPNITRDKQDGLGSWTRADWERFLASGRDPQGHYPAAEMAQVIQNTSALTREDRAALVEYLMDLKPVERIPDEP